MTFFLFFISDIVVNQQGLYRQKKDKKFEFLNEFDAEGREFYEALMMNIKQQKGAVPVFNACPCMEGRAQAVTCNATWHVQNFEC